MVSPLLPEASAATLRATARRADESGDDDDGDGGGAGGVAGALGGLMGGHHKSHFSSLGIELIPFMIRPLRRISNGSRRFGNRQGDAK